MATKQNDQEEGGELIFAGCAAWSMAGRSGPTRNFDGIPLENNCLLDFQRIHPFVQNKTLVVSVFTGPVASHTICLDQNRTAYAWGRNEDGQLGLGDTTNRYNPTKITSITSRVKSGSCGPNHTLLYTTLGELYAAGRNDSGQLGIGNTSSKNTCQLVSDISDVVASSCGRDFSIAVTESGRVYSWGLPQYGQTGQGSEFKSLEKAGKWTYQLTKRPESILEGDIVGVKIVDVKSGPNHTVALDDQGKVYT
jgi:alpha-tubulin suppressor-like RCC1 family protein